MICLEPDPHPSVHLCQQRQRSDQQELEILAKRGTPAFAGVTDELTYPDGGPIEVGAHGTQDPRRRHGPYQTDDAPQDHGNAQPVQCLVGRVAMTVTVFNQPLVNGAHGCDLASNSTLTHCAPCGTSAVAYGIPGAKTASHHVSAWAVKLRDLDGECAPNSGFIAHPQRAPVAWPHDTEPIPLM